MPPVTSLVPGDGSGTLTYTIPGSGLDVETVRVSVDATAAGGPVTATVTITDQSGVVIATKPQGLTIPAGAIGSATWALRLDDDEATGSVANAVLYDTSPQTATFLESTTTDHTWIENDGSSGTRLWDRGDSGIDIEDLAPSGFGGVTIASTAGNIRLIAGGEVQLQAGVASPIELRVDVGQVILNNLQGIGGLVRVADHLGNPIFEIREDGSVHGLAAVGAITWDL